MQYQQQNPYQQGYQQNPYQRQMQQMPQQQMPQQYQQQHMPQFSQQQINSFLNYMQSKPMSNFMADPRYQAQQSKPAPYTPTQQPAITPRAYVPTVKFIGGTSGGMVNIAGRPTVGDAAADAWVQSHRPANTQGAGWSENDPSKLQALYAQYYSGAQ
jgi:hypothetical protein